MKNYFIVFIFLLKLLLLFNCCNSQVSVGELYNDDEIDKKYPDGQDNFQHFKVNYFPTSTNSNYTGEKFRSLENSYTIKPCRLAQSCTLIGASVKIEDCQFFGLAPTGRTPYSIIVPLSFTLTIAGSIKNIPILIVEGRLILHPNYNVTLSFYKMQITPRGTFESAPNQGVNHTIIVEKTLNSLTSTWDREDIPSILSLGGNVTIRGFDSSSTWTGYNRTNQTTFIRSFPFTNNGLPIIKLGGIRNPVGIEQYNLNNYYTNMFKDVYTDKYAFDSMQTPNTGHVLVNPYNKNVWIRGIDACSMVFTGSSTVNIKNSVFYDFGHTTSSPLDESYNSPNRYPITIYHNKKSVNIENNCFLPSINSPQQSLTPRSFIGAVRSFGNIIGNSFVLSESSSGMAMSGISLLYGTEQFNISYNSFISIYSSTTAVPSNRQYPDNINYINSGIISTSPYSFYESNVFEGRFKGGAIHIIPLQSRSTIAGLNIDKLLGIYNGYEQSNLNDKVSNSIWNKVIFKDNVFFGESEFRVTYPMSLQPPIKINFLRGWYINQRPSKILPPNEANVDYSYDSSFIGDITKIYFTEANTLSGKCNSVSLKNVDLSFSYAFFSESFRCNYISIIDSKFSQQTKDYDDSVSFIKKLSNQRYLSNVNGTKASFLDAVTGLLPFYQLSPKSIIDQPLTQNNFTFTFIPNSEAILGSTNQSIETIVDDVFQNGTFLIFPGSSTQSKFVQLPESANGPYTVVLSSKVNYNDGTNYSTGSYFAGTYVVNNNANNFYLGIDLSAPPIDDQSTSRALSIFGKQWTKCNWIQSLNKCTTTGKFSPSSRMTIIGEEITENDEISMITSYLGNDETNNIPSTLNISLAGPHQYKFYLYSYNSDWTDSIINPIPSFTIKINGKYQEPITRSAPSYLAYKKYGPFYWNNINSTEQVLSIAWATDNIKYSIPLSGIEIYSSIQTPFSIPINGQYSNEELYNVNLTNTIHDSEGSEFYNINYFPTSTNSNYTGDNFYSLDKNLLKLTKVTLLNDCVLHGQTASITDCNYKITSQQSGFQNDAEYILPSSDSSLLVKGNVTIYVPVGRTLTISGSPKIIPILIVKGRLLLDPNNDTKFTFYKMQILPNGIFESTPNQIYNHTIVVQKIIDANTAQWDREDIPSVLSISGNVTIRGFDSNSTWTGYNVVNRAAFIRSFPFSDNLPIIKIYGHKSRYTGLEEYIRLDTYFTEYLKYYGGYAYSPQFVTDSLYQRHSIGNILVHPWNKNVWIKGMGSCSMVFTGSSTVDIQNSVILDFGHTTSSLNSNSNIPNRYPITLYHNKKFVKIENNCFLPALFTRVPQQSSTPRSFVGAIRSFGNIIGNSFILSESNISDTVYSMSGISLLYGTEQFNISFNSFISIYPNSSLNNPISSSRQYPDNIDYINGGIITTSPYSFYESNIFEGGFKGGSIQIIPLQSRSIIAGLNSDKLLGIYNGYEQSNLDDKVFNSIWNKVIFKDNVFFGESEVRPTYPMSLQTPIKINFLRGWHINQRPSDVLPPNEANVDYSYDSSFFANGLTQNSWYSYTNYFSGKCNSVSFFNSDLSLSTSSFSPSFKCNYLSMIDSKHRINLYEGDNSSTIVKRYTDQVYFSNLNSSKSMVGVIYSYTPFQKISPNNSQAITQNNFTLSFLPTTKEIFDGTVQATEAFVDGVYQNVTLITLPPATIQSMPIQLPPSTSSLYTVVLSSKLGIPVEYNIPEAGSYFASTYLLDNNANNFYLGIDLAPPSDDSITPRKLSVNDKDWTRCDWIQSLNKCTTSGIFSLSSVDIPFGSGSGGQDEISMIKTYLGNDVTNGIPSVVNISLAGPHSYKFYLYSYNSDWTDSIVNPIPLFTIKINGKYQEPLTRPAPTYLQSKRYGPFYWNNINSTEQVLSIAWATNNIKYSIPLSGIEIYSNIQTPFSIPF
ncbi:hypothetical protein ACTFIY_000324 [Dictyostelium cf. discoideum]